MHRPGRDRRGLVEAADRDRVRWRGSAPADRAGNALVAIGTASTANGTMNTAQANP